MAQRLEWRSGGGEQAWLALLIQSFDAVSRDTRGSSDNAAVAALKLQLSRPAAAVTSSFIALH